MEVNLLSSALYYRLFFLLAFVLSYLVVTLFLKSNNKLNSQHLTLVALSSLAFVIGCKLVPLLDLYFFPPRGENIIMLGQMTLGGIVLGTLTLLVFTRFMRVSYDIIDYYAFATVISLAMQKFGCLFGGCCYGVGNGIIMISYDGGVAHNALPVYHILAYITLFISFFNARRWNLKPGTLGFISIVFYSLIQLMSEFYRTNAQTIAFSEEIMGLKILQWVYIVLLLFAVLLVLKNEIGSSRSSQVLSNNHPSVSRIGIVILLTILILIISKDYLYKIEIYAVNVALIPALIFLLIRIYQKLTIPKYRIASLLFTIVPLFLMSQSIVETDTTKNYSYHTLGVGFKTGDANNMIIFDTTPGSCDSNSTRRSFNHTFNLLGLGYSYAKVENEGLRNKTKVEFGINSTIGKHTEIPFDDPSKVNEVNIFNVNPFVYLDSRWIGAKFGAHIGSSSRLLTKDVYETGGPILTGSKQSLFIPQFSARLGPIQYFFIEYNYASQFLSPLPEMPQNFTMGSGFGLDNGFYFKLGFHFNSEKSTYISSYIPIKDKFVIEPLYRFGTSNQAPGIPWGNTFMLGASYRFGAKPIKPKSK